MNWIESLINVKIELFMMLKLRQISLFFLLSAVSIITNAQVKATPDDERVKGLEKRKILESRSVLNDVSFRNIGPTVFSGRVSDIDANPDDPTEFYVAYSSGGLWYTNNNGLSFTPVFDNEHILTMGDVAVDWKTGTVWVGTGEVNSSRSSYSGIGVYKSTDKAKTWQYLGLPGTHHIGKIQLHPTDPNTAWVAALGHLYSPNKERGVFKTTDGGKTWKHTLFIDENTGIVEMDINPKNPLELYAAAWYRTRSAWNFEESGKTSGMYKSTDGGNSWTKISTPSSGFPDGEGVGRIGIAVFPQNPQVVYAVVDNNFRRPDTAAKKQEDGYVLRDFEKLSKEEFANLDNDKLDTFLKRNRMINRYSAKTVKELVAKGEIKPTALFQYLFDANAALFDTPIEGAQVYRSNDGGKSWKRTHQKEISFYFTYGYYFGKIYVSPYNPEKIYILGFDAQLSTDGGKTFNSIDKNNVHADHHALWVNPKRDSHLIDGNDGGINISYDDGKVWYKANSPAVGQFYSVEVDHEEVYNVYGGLQDNGVWYTPSKTTRSRFTGSGLGVNDDPAKFLGGGDGMQVQVDRRNNLTTYYGSQFGNYARTNRLTREGTKRITPRHDLGEVPLRFNWQTPILLSRHNQDILYFGANKFYRSLDQGDSMSIMSQDLTNGGKPGDVPYGTLTTISESPLRFGLLYTGSDDGNIHLSKDGGYTWTKVSQSTSLTRNVPAGLWVSRVTASAHQLGRVYATFNGYRNDHFEPYVFVSEDYGNTWKKISSDLPPEPVNVIKEDPTNENILYVGTDGGLYVSLDRGKSFMMWNNGLPKSVPVHDLVIHEREHEIVLGTHGRSFYIAPLENLRKAVK